MGGAPQQQFSIHGDVNGHATWDRRVPEHRGFSAGRRRRGTAVAAPWTFKERPSGRRPGLLLGLGVLFAWSGLQAVVGEGFPKTSVPRFELVWERQADPRAQDNKPNIEDGITVECVEFSPDGKCVAAGTGLGEVKLYNTDDGTPVRTYVYATDPQDETRTHFKRIEVESIAFSTDGRLLAAGGNGKGIKVFRVGDGEVVQAFELRGEVDGMSMSPCGRFFAHASRHEVAVRKIGDWEIVHSVPHDPPEGKTINSIDFTKDGHYMISAGMWGRVIITDTQGWRELRTCLAGRVSTIKSTRLSPDGRYLAVGYGGRQVVVFRFDDASVVKEIPMAVYIEAVAWTADGRYLLAGGRDEGMLHVFASGEWAEIAAVPAQKHSSVEYIDTFGDLIIVGGEDGCIRLFRVHTG